MASRKKRDGLASSKLSPAVMVTPVVKSAGHKRPSAGDTVGSSCGDSRSSTPVSVVSNGSMHRTRSSSRQVAGGKSGRGNESVQTAKKSRSLMLDVVDDDDCELGLEAVDETESHSDSNYEDNDDDNDEVEEANDEIDTIPDENTSIAHSEGMDSISNSGASKKVFPRRPKTPDFLFEDVEIPPLNLPESSADLVLTGKDVMVAFGIYEVLRRFRAIVRLSPFRFEDFCASLVAGKGDEQSVLLVEIHIQLLRSLLREDDGNNTTFGPYDIKDSIAISMFFIDPLTWYECIRAYLDSELESAEFRAPLPTLSHESYSEATVSERLSLLQTLTNLFLSTNGVRQLLAVEGDILHDDHCRVCHKLGDLLCCETCPAVYHLYCLETPLDEVPEDEWICSVCKAQEVKGVTDCISDVEKSGLLCRQEPIGYDRHFRKYYFICRRIIVESETGDDVWYYSTKLQLNELLLSLDGEKFEKDLVQAITEIRDEIDRQMDLTAELTNEKANGKKSCIEVLDKKLQELNAVRAQQLQTDDDGNTVDRQSNVDECNESCPDRALEGESSAIDSVETKCGEFLDVDSSNDSTPLVGNTAAGCDQTLNAETGLMEDVASASLLEKSTDELPADEAAEDNSLSSTPVRPGLSFQQPPTKKVLMVIDKDGSKTYMTITQGIKDKTRSNVPFQDAAGNTVMSTSNGRKMVTRSKTGSLTPKQFTDSVTATSGSLKAAIKSSLDEYESSRTTRNRTSINMAYSDINQYTGPFKLGLEGGYRQYQNQYSANSLALNKHQHNEEREKKRHMSHKFSLSSSAEFNWPGAIYGSVQTLVNTLRASLVQLENRLPPVFLHPNWPQHRARWIKMVNGCRTPEEFGAVMTTFEASVKPVVFNPVWRDALGHTRLQRTPFLDVEEKKKKERQERQDTKKKKVEEEEETLNSLTWVKYSLGVRHQIWKQRGEEYRITGQGGWIWVSVTRRYRLVPAASVGLRLVAAKLQARKLRQRGINESTEVDILTCKETDTCSADLLKDESSKNEDEADSENVRLGAVELSACKNDCDNSDSSDKVWDCPNDSMSQLFDESFSISEALISHSAYPRITKPYSRLDHLLDRRTAQRQVELKQRAFCEQLVNQFRSQSKPGCGKQSALLTSNTGVNDVKLQTTDASHNSSNSEVPPTNVKSVTSIRAHTSCACYSSVCRHSCSASACYSAVCRVQSRAPCQGLTGSVPSRSELGDSGVVDNCDLDKITSNLPNSVKEVDNGSSDVKLEPSCELLMDAASSDGFQKDDKAAVSRDIATTVAASNSLTAVDSQSVTESLKCKVEPAVQSQEVSSLNTAKPARPVSPSLCLQKYTNSEGQITLTAAFIEELEAKLALFDQTCHKVALGKRAGPGRPPTKVTGTSVVNGSSSAQKKLPPVQHFRSGHAGQKSMFALDRQVVRSVARREGKRECPGFNYSCKMNNVGWPYPCPRPNFCMAWRYRTQTLRSIPAAAIQFRILWACIRWDDLNARPPASGANTLTTESDITTTELLQKRDVPPHDLRSEYLVRTIVVPINVQTSQHREKYTPQRSGLRERRRAESPKQKTPTSTEVWLPEEHLELWQIKQFTEKVEKQKALAIENKQKMQLKQQVDAMAASAGIATMVKSNIIINSASRMELAAQMEEQLRQQRLSMAQKRLAEAQGRTLLPGQTATTSASFTSSLGTRPQLIDLRPKTSLIGSPVLTPRGNIISLTAASTQSTAAGVTSTGIQNIRIVPGLNGQLQVHGLQTGQQVIRLPDGRLQFVQTPGKPPTSIVSSSPAQSSPVRLSSQKIIVSNLSQPAVPRPVIIIGGSSVAQTLPTLGRPRLHQQLSAGAATPNVQQIVLRSAGPVKQGSLTDLSTITLSASCVLPAASPPASPSNASSGYSVTPQVVQQVLAQALLQKQNPDVQAKLLAMQRQMHVGSSTDDELIADFTSPPVLPLRTPALAAQEARLSKLTSEHKEEQTRMAACVQVMKSLLDAVERRERIDLKRERIEIKRQQKQENSEEKHKRVSQHKLETMLYKHKEGLKRDIIKKRSMLEKEIAQEIQAEITQVLAAQQIAASLPMPAESPVKKRKYDSLPTTFAKQPIVSQPASRLSYTQVPEAVPVVQKAESKRGRKRKQTADADDYSKASYSSVPAVPKAVTNSSSKSDEKLYCLCKTPYDESKFYIGCDKCDDWYHGSCVGITKAEADKMDSYVCPLCRGKTASSKVHASVSVSLTLLQENHWNELRRVVSSLQAHRSGWPFLEPVNAAEVPDYYTIIKEPIDLQTIMKKVSYRQYKYINDFVKDVTKMFDNCRYYNAPQSPFYRCAEALEIFFVEKMRQFNLKL